MKIKYSLILLTLNLINSFDCFSSALAQSEQSKLKLDNNLIRYLEIQLKNTRGNETEKSNLAHFLKNQNYCFMLDEDSSLLEDNADLIPKDLQDILNKFKYNNKNEEYNVGHVAKILGDKSLVLDMYDDHPVGLTFSEDLTLLFGVNYSCFRLIGHKDRITCANFNIVTVRDIDTTEFVVSGDISGKVIFWHPFKKLIFSCAGHTSAITKISIPKNSRSFKTYDFSGKSIDWTFLDRDNILVSTLGQQKVTLEYSQDKFKKQEINLTDNSAKSGIVSGSAAKAVDLKSLSPLGLPVTVLAPILEHETTAVKQKKINNSPVNSAQSIDLKFFSQVGAPVSTLAPVLESKTTQNIQKTQEKPEAKLIKQIKQEVYLTDKVLSRLIILKHSFRYLNIDFDITNIRHGEIIKLDISNPDSLKNPQDKLLLIEAILFRIKRLLTEDRMKFPATDLLGWLFEYFSSSHNELSNVTYPKYVRDNGFIEQNLYDEVSIFFAELFNLVD